MPDDLLQVNDVESIGWDFAAIMKRVEAGDEVEITINGKPEAVIISFAEYERLTTARLVALP